MHRRSFGLFLILFLSFTFVGCGSDPIPPAPGGYDGPPVVAPVDEGLPGDDLGDDLDYPSYGNAGGQLPGDDLDAAHGAYDTEPSETGEGIYGTEGSGTESGDDHGIYDTDDGEDLDGLYDTDDDDHGTYDTDDGEDLDGLYDTDDNGYGTEGADSDGDDYPLDPGYPSDPGSDGEYDSQSAGPYDTTPGWDDLAMFDDLLLSQSPWGHQDELMAALTAVAGVGDLRAEAILNAMPIYGTEDLLAIPGIGQVTVQRLIEAGFHF